MMGGPMMDRHWANSPMARLFGSYERTEFEALRSELGGKTLGELSGADISAWMDRFSVARQKDRWLAGSAAASMMLPGKGQFMNGDSLGGSLFLAAHLATVAGSAVLWYFVLPAELRFDQLNYYTASWATIKSRWEGESLEGYLPSIGVMVGGAAVDMIWRAWSSRSAVGEAKAGIDGGRVSFQPMDAAMGLGLRMRY